MYFGGGDFCSSFLRGGGRILFQKIPVGHEVNCNESRSTAAVTLTNERLDVKASMCT